jgi:dihydroorotase-like cyclic amidohydrolase
MRLDLFIRGGHVVFPRSGVRKANIGVRNGKIVGIYDEEERLDAVKELDVTGLYVFPGLIDAHEHLGIYNSVEEDFLDTKEHAIGGITTVINYDRQPVSYHEFFPKVREIGERCSYIDFGYSLGILTEQHIDELEEYVLQYGLTSFKFFRNYERQLNAKFKITNGIDLSSADLVRILKRCKEISWNSFRKYGYQPVSDALSAIQRGGRLPAYLVGDESGVCGSRVDAQYALP